MRRKVLAEYGWIVLGTLALALGINLFLVPVKLSTGGIGSIATMLFYLFRIPLSVTNLLLNIILFFVGYKLIGKKTIFRTGAGVLLLSVFLELSAGFSIDTKDVFMAALLGGLLCGAGVGLVVRQEASTGGSDFAAVLLHKIFAHLSVANLLLIVDLIIVVISGIVFGSLRVMFYSLVALVVATKAADALLTMGDIAKSVYIISGRHAEIAACVHTQLERGATGIRSQGMYSGKDAVMLLCVVSPKELPHLVHIVRDIDKGAFIVISDVREVWGEGFKK